MKKEDDPFMNFSKFISAFLIAMLFLSILILATSCSTKQVRYDIYLEHQPSEPLYTTFSLEDAEEYFKQYKPFHSDMYIISTNEDYSMNIKDE